MKATSSMCRLRPLLVAWLALVHGSSATAQAPGAVVHPLSALPRERIAVETRSAHRYLFEAWRADSFAARAQGLMFVTDEEMRKDQAMIFVYEPAQRVSMWMKNTLLSLDMLFVDRRGCIVALHERAAPRSLATIDSLFPVTLVVELKGGIAAERGIRTGDRVLLLDSPTLQSPGGCAPPP
jgi:uncharacterized protein